MRAGFNYSVSGISVIDDIEQDSISFIPDAEAVSPSVQVDQLGFILNNCCFENHFVDVKILGCVTNAGIAVGLSMTPVKLQQTFPIIRVKLIRKTDCNSKSSDTKSAMGMLTLYH